jgi:UDP-3-O-[3-hydroxymyristoyl] glucosamine N-acyltransferase
MLGTLNELAGRVGGRVVGDGSVVVESISSIDEATPDTMTFATDERYYARALECAAGAVLVGEDLPAGDAPSKPLLVVPHTRAALATLLAMLRPPRPQAPFTHPTAVVEPDAEIGEGVHIGANAYVGSKAKIGRGAVIGVGAYVGAEASVGENAWVHPRASLMERCAIGERVVLHAGCVIGSEGFGWAFIDGRLERIPQVGNVVLDDDVEIGANSCVDRAQTGSTRIGKGTKVDNLVQIGHNCRIGANCAFAALTGLAGSTVVGDNVQVAGQVGTRGHMTIGSRVTIAGKAGVWGDIPDGATISGDPARSHRERLKTEVMLHKLPKLFARVDALERERSRDAD